MPELVLDSSIYVHVFSFSGGVPVGEYINEYSSVSLQAYYTIKHFNILKIIGGLTNCVTHPTSYFASLPLSVFARNKN